MMKTIIVLVMINGLSGANNFSFATVSGFNSLDSCKIAAEKISKEKDLFFKTDFKCIEVKK